MPENPDENIPERPLECGECKKPIAVRYTEIAGNHFTETSMCESCPELQHRLRGQNAENGTGSQISKTGVACGNCGTTLQAVKFGAPLGCPNCYEIFRDVIISELLNLGKISPRAASAKKNVPLHLGRHPKETIKFNPSAQLIALNEALTETLKQEDYEQAAFLRDQIKALTDKSDEGLKP